MNLTTLHISNDYITKKYNIKQNMFQAGHLVEIIKDEYLLDNDFDGLTNLFNNLKNKYPNCQFRVNSIMKNYDETSVEFWIVRKYNETADETIERLKAKELKDIKEQYEIYCKSENFLIQALNFSVRKNNEII